MARIILGWLVGTEQRCGEVALNQQKLWHFFFSVVGFS
jgi:hypothetical protein